MASATASAGDPQQLESLLAAFTNPDNEARRRAEAAWEDLKQGHPDEVLENMCAILGREDGEVGEAAGLRTMAAVLLRTLFDIRSDVWFRAQERTQKRVKVALLGRMTKEPVAHIRRKLTHTIGQLAEISSETAEWPELVTVTVALCDATEQSPEMKVVGLDLVNILAEFCPDMMAPHRADLLQMFEACLDDANVGVRVTALKAACSFLPGPSAVAAPSLVPKMMSVLEAAVNSADVGVAGEVLEALNVIAANQPLILIGDPQSLDTVGSTMLALAAIPTLEDSMRELSLEVITGLCESAPSVFREGGGGIIGEVVPLTVNMLARHPQGHESAEELVAWLSTADGSEDDMNGHLDGDSLSNNFANALHRISNALRGEAMLSSVMPVCSEFLQDPSSWRRRKAGLLTLFLIGEGSGEHLAGSGLLPELVLGPVLAGMQDEHPRVRNAALSCAEHFMEYPVPDEGSFQGAFHRKLLPVLVSSLGGPNANMPRLQATAAGAITTFCDPERLRAEWLNENAAPPGSRLGQEAVGVVLLRSLEGLVPPSGSSCVAVREEAWAAVGVVSQVVGPQFGSFYDTFVPLAKETVFAGATPTGPAAAAAAVTPSEESDGLRGKAVEAMAHMGQAVGLEVFWEDAHQVIRFLLNEQKTVARDPGNPQSTYTFQALARLAGVLGEEFIPCLSEAVTPLLAALSTEAEITLSDAADADLATLELEDAGLTAMAMDLRGAGAQVFGVNSSLMEAKESACKALYQYAEDLGEGFAPHAAATLPVVLPNLGPKNAVGVQVVSAALVPRLVGFAARRAEAAAAAGGSDAVESVREAQAILDASVDALTEMVSRLGGDSGGGGALGGGSAQQEEPFEKGDQEPACVVADSLSNLLEGRCSDGGYEEAGVLGVSDERLSSTVTVLRDVAAASIRRTRSLLAARKAAAAVSAGGMGGMTGAEEAAELAELEEGEEEMLVSVADATGWMIRGRKAAFLPTFEAVMRPLVLPLLDSTAAAAAALPSSHRSFGLSVAIDVLEHAGEGGRRAVFPEPLLPALLQGCREDELAASARQVCAYGLGVAAELGGPEFDPHSAEALRLLLALVAQGRAGNTAGTAREEDDEEEDDEEDDEEEHGEEDDDDRWENGALTDNAISAAFLVLFARPGPVGAAFAAAPMSAVVGSLLDALPIAVDVDEAHDCHRRVVDHALSRHELFFGGGNGGGGSSGATGYAAAVVPKLLAALAGMVQYQPSQEEGDAAAAAAAGGSWLPSSARSGGGYGAGDSQEEVWARQLVDKETRQKAEEVLVRIKGEYPEVFEDVWAGLGEERRRALQTTTAEICAR